MAILFVIPPTLADDKPDKPAEEQRFGAARFRAGLRKRGLLELLELHLREFPPSGKTASLMMRRDLHLAEFADTSRPLADRMAALADANQLLEQLVDENPADRRRFDWRFTLAHSLLYEEAEAHFSSIIYRGGNANDRQSLQALATRAVRVLTALTDEIASEYETFDGLPLGQFERLERSGYVEELDRLAPRAEYLLLWALFYDALPRDDTDPVRASHLNRIHAALTQDRVLLDASHEISRVQVQALLLDGMACRLLNDHPTARQRFDRALQVAKRLGDPVERERISWAILLAQLERIRNDRDDGRFDDALRGLVGFRKSISDRAPGAFGQRVVAALEERAVYRALAAQADREEDPAAAKRARARAWLALERLVSEYASQCDEVYATVYELIGADADPASLDPFEQCALVAGLLVQADLDGASGERRWRRAIQVGEGFLASATPEVESLIPAVLYNVAVAQYRLDRPKEAAVRFLEVAREHSRFSNAAQAAALAVQLGSLMYEDTPPAQRSGELRSLYFDALETLLFQHADTETARYWRFYYAQLLDELGRHDDAIVQYALVDVGHEHYLESVFSRVRSTALALKQVCAARPVDALDVQRRTTDHSTLHREFVARATSEMNRATDPAEVSRLRGLIGRAELVAAETDVLGPVDRPTRALDRLRDFEQAFPELAGITGRLWRVRLLAYERLGRLDEATQTIPLYVAADPQGAGPALQSLFDGLSQDVRRLRREGDTDASAKKAKLVLLLAEQIEAWSRTPEADVAPGDRLRITRQLAEANLLAERYAPAKELFAQLRKTDGKAQPSDPCVLHGYAEALYQLGEHAAALPEFNELARRLPEGDPLRWESLLRDLQCRTALKQNPRDVIKVIEQQAYLNPELGGPRLAAEFKKLLRENQRRAEGG